MTGPPWPRRVRATTLVPFVLLGMVSFSARTAQATGCHVQERPTLGLTRSLDPSGLLGDPVWQAATHASGSRVRLRLVPRPCSEEIPNAIGSTGDLPSIAPTAAFATTRDLPQAGLASEPPTLHPRHQSEVPERPPRT